MESDLSGKHFEFSTVVEYFTKRGKPLSQSDLTKLIEEDRLQKEDQEEERRG
jgi:hypothetical protein